MNKPVIPGVMKYAPDSSTAIISRNMKNLGLSILDRFNFAKKGLGICSKGDLGMTILGLMCLGALLFGFAAAGFAASLILICSLTIFHRTPIRHKTPVAYTKGGDKNGFYF